MQHTERAVASTFFPVAEEEPHTKEAEAVCAEETDMHETEEDTIDIEVRYASRLQAICYVFFSSVIIAAVWGIIRWGWIEWGWLPQAKSYVPQWVIPGILTAAFLLVCHNFIRSFRGLLGRYAWLAISVLPFFLFMTTGRMIERMSLNVSEIQAITPEMEPTLAEADYIHVAKISTAELDTIRVSYYSGISTQNLQNRIIIFHLYGVFPLRAIPNMYIAKETTERHDYTYSSKEALDEKYRQFKDKEVGFLLKEKMTDRYLKRLLPSDNIEGYQEAIREICEKKNKPFDKEKIVIYEFNSDTIARVETNHYRDTCLIILFFEVLSLLFIYAVFFDREKYKQAVISSRKWKESILRATPDKILVYSLPTLMAVIFLMMLLNGYSMDTTNKEMLMQWGALERVSVFGRHEWWRLLSYGFLHNGFIHLFGNLSVFVYSVFIMMQKHNGYRITLVFLLSTLLSGIVILVFSTNSCVGASGGVFGLMAFWIGYELYTASLDKDHKTSPKVSLLLIMIVLNLIFSFGNGISMSGHLGGLLAGIILAIIIGTKDNSRHGKDISVKKKGVLISKLLIFIVAIALLYLFGYEKNASVQEELGLAYYNGTIGNKPDYEKAVKYFHKAAKLGNVYAQYNLGLCYDTGIGVEQDYTEAAKWYHKSAEQGYTDAQNNFGLCYELGHGVEQDYDEAVKWYRKAVEQGNSHAQCNLGLCYELGHGLEQDYDEAVKWYHKSAGQGNETAQSNLGTCYKLGQGVTQSYAEAVKWFRMAVEQGYAPAQNKLGKCYELGQGVTQDYDEAFKLYRKAAEQGDVNAEYNLGQCYENGHGVEKDYNEAIKWYEKAAEQEDTNAREALERLRR